MTAESASHKLLLLLILLFIFDVPIGSVYYLHNNLSDLQDFRHQLNSDFRATCIRQKARVTTTSLEPGSAGEIKKSPGFSGPRSIRRCYYFCLVKRVANTTHGIIYRLSDVMHGAGQMV